MNVLIIDDVEHERNQIRDALKQTGNNVRVSNDADFMAHLDPQPDIIITDLIMPNSDGLSVIRQLKALNINSKIIFMSVSDRKILESAEKYGKAHGFDVAGVLRKPVNFSEMQTLIAKEKSDIRNSQRMLHDEDTVISLLKGEQIVGVFQEQICLKTGRVTAAEVLARLQDTESGQFIYPDNFLDIAMRHNLTHLVTRVVWKQAVAMRKFLAGIGKHLNISVNMTVNDFDDAELPQRLRHEVLSAGLEPQSFTIEITETTVYQNYLLMLESLTRLRMYGFNLSIDDFGTGYSSLKQLADLPFNELKIDREFVMRFEREEPRAIIDTSIELAKKIGLSVVAEGVETEASLDYLKSRGCDLAQGYLIGKPMSRHEFMSKLRIRD